ncbi:HNH endonuclease [Sporosarcina highlanderae]|uniref:Putative HNH nuclease YajD n=1 Tax=Sporosarcina highlanderae TaxID=3035916 RepID=A0ABT8JWF1_9BACL|nr:HNH endonuclease [Sporosarcina highlanderae]MDN4609133.1 HNH endonuclease [Sporosarcina highlanderae]
MKYGRYKSDDKFYRTKTWDGKRKTIFRRDEYRCRECRRYGNTTPATTVHHIFPLELYPEFGLTNINLLSLCNGCHEGMHNRLTGELTAKGKQWCERIKKQLFGETKEKLTPPL